MMHIKGRQKIEEELRRRRLRLFAGSQPLLLDALVREIPSIEDAIVVGHIPEQFEEIFVVLVDSEHVAVVEIAREPERHVTKFELRSAVEYSKGLSKRNKRQFIVAREMIANDNENDSSLRR